MIWVQFLPSVILAALLCLWLRRLRQVSLLSVLEQSNEEANNKL